MRTQPAVAVLSGCLVAMGGMLLTNIAPHWLTVIAGANPGGPETTGMIAAGFGLFQLGRRRPAVRFVAD